MSLDLILKSSLVEKELFLFDVDGVLYVGKDEPRLLGGVELLKTLDAVGKKYYVLTNNSTQTTKDIHHNLTSLGFEIPLDRVLTSSELLAEYIFKRWGPSRCHLIGEKGLRDELERYSHSIQDKNSQFVVVGLDRALTYEKLNKAAKTLKSGARLLATHTSRFYMDSDGPNLAPGAIVKALEYASGKKATFIGKPSPLMFRSALRRAGVGANKTVMVGDQIETDIAGAKKMGIFSILVRTGVDKYPSRSVEPDMILDKLDDLIPLVRTKNRKQN